MTLCAITMKMEHAEILKMERPFESESVANLDEL